jgi:hypothetical protein
VRVFEVWWDEKAKPGKKGSFTRDLYAIVLSLADGGRSHQPPSLKIGKGDDLKSIVFQMFYRRTPENTRKIGR